MLINNIGREFIIKDTHRGLFYENGQLTKVLEAGRYKIPPRRRWFRKLPTVEWPVGRCSRARANDQGPGNSDGRPRSRFALVFWSSIA